MCVHVCACVRKDRMLDVDKRTGKEGNEILLEYSVIQCWQLLNGESPSGYGLTEAVYVCRDTMER